MLHQSLPRVALSEPSPTVISDKYNIEADLLQGYRLRSFLSYSNLKQLKDAAKAIYDQLEKNRKPMVGYQGYITSRH